MYTQNFHMVKWCALFDKIEAASLALLQSPQINYFTFYTDGSFHANSPNDRRNTPSDLLANSQLKIDAIEKWKT